MQRFHISSDVVFGTGALNSLADIADKKVLLITDSFMSGHGVADMVSSHLTHCTVSVFDAVVPEPPIDIVAAGVKALEASQAEVILALGGGSVIDAAKAIRQVYAESHENTEQAILIAVPTTSGTGSEVTVYAVVTDPAKGIKYPLADAALLPELAILDPELTKSIPASITADTGMDVLTHAIEAYVSTGANEFSDALVEHACSLVFTYLPRAVNDGSDMEAREKMHVASCMAGMAFSSAALGCAHGCAHAIGARFHIPHGRSCALTLLEVMKFNADLDAVRGGNYSLAAQKYARLALLLGFSAATTRLGAQNLISAVERLRARINSPASLKEAGVDVAHALSHLDELVELALTDATTQTNPRPADKESIRKILIKVIQG